MYDYLNSSPLEKKIIKSITLESGEIMVHFCNVKVAITA